MRRPCRDGLIWLVALISAAAIACQAPGAGGPSPATERATRRAYDGAPPVIAHENFGMACISCHNRQGMELEDVGFAPPSPHDNTAAPSAISRCRQCHVFRQTEALLVGNSFVGLEQDLRRGARLNALAPPTIPHRVFMRENCAACHTGEAARVEIVTPHPERSRCRQCHVPVRTRDLFHSELDDELVQAAAGSGGDPR